MKLSSFVMLSSQDAKLSSRVVAELSLLVAAVELAFLVVAVELSLLLAVAELALLLAAVEMALLVVATELAAIVVVATQVIAVVVAVTKVDALVVVAKGVVGVAVTSPNWKFQSLHRQTQCPACAIGHDSQCSFQVFIHHSLQGIPACFYGGQVLPCPQVL
jgi:hypothetical protein